MTDSIWSRRSNENSTFLASTGADAKKVSESQQTSVPTSLSSTNSKSHNSVANHTPKPQESSLPKSPLQTSWTVWFLNRHPGFMIGNYLKATKQVGSFDTVEGMWEVYSHLRRADRLPFTSEFQIFRKGVKPFWEDPENENGGKWVVRRRRAMKQTNNEEEQASTAAPSGEDISHTLASSIASIVEDVSTGPTNSLRSSSSAMSGHKIARMRQKSVQIWEQLVLALVGGTLGEGLEKDEITGIVLSVRREEDIFSVWNKSGRDKQVIETLRKRLESILQTSRSSHLNYKVNSESLKEKLDKKASYDSRKGYDSKKGKRTEAGDEQQSDENDEQEDDQ